VPGTTPCANQRKFLASLGVKLPLSNGTPGSNDSLVEQNNHSIAPRLGICLGCLRQREDGSSRWGWSILPAGTCRPRARSGSQCAVCPRHQQPTGLSMLPHHSPAHRYLPVQPSPQVAIFPNSWQWNVSLEQEVARNTTLQVGYVGNVGEHLTSMYDGNFIQPGNWLNSAFANGGSAINAYRPAFNFGQIGGFARGGPCFLQLAAGAVPGADGHLLHLPGGLYLVALAWKRRAE